MRKFTALVGLVAVSSLLAGQPVITSVSPRAALPGDEIVIRGAALSGVTHVRFIATVGGFLGTDIKDVAVVSAAESEIKARVPKVAGFAPPDATPPGNPAGSLRVRDRDGKLHGKLEFVFRQAAAEPFEGFGTALAGKGPARGKARLRADDGKDYVLELKGGLTVPGPGKRVWVKGTVKGGRLQATELLAFSHRSAKDLGFDARIGSVTASLSRVYAWCDHMPGIGAPRKRQHLIVDVTLDNPGAKPVEVRLAPVFLSLRADSEGDRTDELSIRGANGMGTGRVAYTLQPGKHVVQLRGDGVFPEDAHGKALWVTLVTSVGKERGTLRRFGTVQVTH